MASEPTYQLTLLRHAESEGNARNLWQGQDDYSLTPHGKEQAGALANHWLSEGALFDLAISSPLSRALETAQIIATALGLSLESDPIWMERNNGNLAGKRREDLPEMPDFVHTFMPVGESGESIMSLYLRAGKALNGILQRPPGSYLIVSHGGILNMVMYAALGIAPLAHFRGPRFAFGNTGFSTLRFLPQRGQWQVLGINETRHLAALGGSTIWQP